MPVAAAIVSRLSSVFSSSFLGVADRWVGSHGSGVVPVAALKWRPRGRECISAWRARSSTVSGWSSRSMIQGTVRRTDGRPGRAPAWLRTVPGRRPSAAVRPGGGRQRWRSTSRGRGGRGAGPPFHLRVTPAGVLLFLACRSGTSSVRPARTTSRAYRSARTFMCSSLLLGYLDQASLKGGKAGAWRRGSPPGRQGPGARDP
jgi:hypothetical protein